MRQSTPSSHSLASPLLTKTVLADFPICSYIDFTMVSSISLELEHFLAESFRANFGIALFQLDADDLAA